MEDKKPRRTPTRTCAACRSSTGKNMLVRIVRTTGGAVKVDPTGKAPGRGAYVCRSAHCIAEAAKRKRLDRALRTSVPPAVYEDLSSLVTSSEAGAKAES